MDILLLNYEFPPLGGGAGRATYHLAEELAKKGHTVHVLTSRDSGEKSEELIKGFTVFRVYSLRKGIHDCGFRGALTYVLSASLKFLKLTRQNRYDVIHYFFSLPTGFISLLPGAHRKIPYIISLRGSDVPGYDIYNLSLQKVHGLVNPLTRLIWKKAKKVVALSNGLKLIALQTAPHQKMDVIPNAIDSQLFYINSAPKKSNDVLKLITVARLIERKGIQHILYALLELQDKQIELMIVGTGQYEQALKSLSEGLSLNRQVTFYGSCPQEKLANLYGLNDVFILPSLAESFGMVFLEAMACGLPVIAGRVGGVPDIIKDDNGILVAPGVIAEIKNAIVKLKKDHRLRVSMAKANRTKVEQSYLWNIVAEKYLTAYKS